jgi:feruloyl-CoA hydratase/lyase
MTRAVNVADLLDGSPWSRYQKLVAKHGFKRCRELTWEQSEDYLYAKLDQAQFRDPGHGREKGLRQFLDEKTSSLVLKAIVVNR